MEKKEWTAPEWTAPDVQSINIEETYSGIWDVDWEGFYSNDGPFWWFFKS